VKRLPDLYRLNSTPLDLREACRKHYPLLQAIHQYYSAVNQQGGDDLFSISMAAFTQLLNECRMTDESVPGIRSADFMILFASANAKLRESKEQGKEYNSTRTLNREEWLAVIVQIVFARHVASGDQLDVSSAFDAFAEQLHPHLPTAVFHDPNEFRAACCYNESVDYSLRRFEAPLKTLFEAFAYGSGDFDLLFSTRLMDVAEYRLLLEGRLGAVDNYITRSDLEFAYAYSRMLVINEHARGSRAKFVQLHFVRRSRPPSLPLALAVQTTHRDHVADLLPPPSSPLAPPACRCA
jgi:hypothetical protein